MKSALKRARAKKHARLKARAMVQVALSERAIHESRIVLGTMRILRAQRLP